MAKVQIGRYEAQHFRPPNIRMRCGRPAVLVKSKKFAWHPPWLFVLVLAGVLIYFIVAIVMTKRMTVQVPLIRRRAGLCRGALA